MTRSISLEIANKMLPLLRSTAVEVMTLWREIRAARHILDTDADLSSKEQSLMRENLQKRVDRLTEVLDEIEHLGCTVESYGEGIIDIPSLIDGREVLLCWKYGEEEIRYYHLPGENADSRVLVNAILE